MSAAAPSPWIISRRDDLLWFQGSVLAGVALLVTDSELRVQFANRSFEEMSGVASGAASGQHAIRWLRLTPADMNRLRDQRDVHLRRAP